jgi:hypothetical protein
LILNVDEDHDREINGGEADPSEEIISRSAGK